MRMRVFWTDVADAFIAFYISFRAQYNANNLYVQ